MKQNMFAQNDLFSIFTKFGEVWTLMDSHATQASHMSHIRHMKRICYRLINILLL